MAYMKILSVSLGRSGTKSLEHFLNKNNINALHGYDHSIDPEMFEENLSGIEKYFDTKINEAEAFLDIPYCFAIEYFLKKYADAKFIYIKRDVESWINSMNSIKNVWPHEKPFIFEKAYCNIYTKTNKDKIEDLTDQELYEIWNLHDKNIEYHLSGNPNFLQIYLNDDDIAEKISNFLNIEAKYSFPKINTKEYLNNY